MDKSSTTWQTRFEYELEQAEAARAKNNEGMARVCARRAAGIAIGEYLARRNIAFPSPSVHERLKFLASLPDMDPVVLKIAHRLLLRVDQDFNLPARIDLIVEARRIAQILLNPREE